MAVNAMPHHIYPTREKTFWYLKVNISLVIHTTIEPTINAIATDIRMPDMITSVLPELIKRPMSCAINSSLPLILTVATAIADPRRPKTSDTVVDVGRPNVLKRSRRMTLANITPRNSIITSENVNSAGLNTPDRATSIMPLEVRAPIMIPTEATSIITQYGAALEPRAE